MSGFFHDVAGAALPVAVVLLLCAAVAGGVLWAQAEDARAQRLAREHLEPLSTCGLAAIGALVLAGEATGLAVTVALVLAGGAVLVRQAGNEPWPAAAPAAPEPAPSPEQEPPAAPLAPADSPLWAGRGTRPTTREAGLWDG